MPVMSMRLIASVLTTRPKPLKVTDVAAVVPSACRAITLTRAPLSPMPRVVTILGDTVVEGGFSQAFAGLETLTTQEPLVLDNSQVLSSWLVALLLTNQSVMFWLRLIASARAV